MWDHSPLVQSGPGSWQMIPHTMTGVQWEAPHPSRGRDRGDQVLAVLSPCSPQAFPGVFFPDGVTQCSSDPDMWRLSLKGVCRHGLCCY